MRELRDRAYLFQTAGLVLSIVLRLPDKETVVSAVTVDGDDKFGVIKVIQKFHSFFRPVLYHHTFTVESNGFFDDFQINLKAHDL